MAVLDPRNDTIVIRVVYDGAPMAGKSTSVGVLGRGLNARVYSPATVNGRTLYFDWLDYTGGQFEGRKIRCQIISVPGQAILAPRRRLLLESADAVVFVGDSSPAGFISDRGHLSSLGRVLEQIPGPPVGLVLQANKRDHPHAIPVAQIRSMLESMGLRIGVVESVASNGTGIREAFVFAVRLALDRAREQMRTKQLPEARPQVDTPRELLDLLKKSEAGSLDYAAELELVHTRAGEVQPQSIVSEAIAQASREDEILAEGDAIAKGDAIARGDAIAQGDAIARGDAIAQGDAIARGDAIAQGDAIAKGHALPKGDALAKGHVPATPDERVRSGLVWPPVDGRTVLHEIGQARIQLSCSKNGDWSGIAQGRWQIHSEASAVFDDLNAGRMVLVKTARAHAASNAGRTLDKCVALASDGQGRWRLWQITRLPEAAAVAPNADTPKATARSA